MSAGAGTRLYTPALLALATGLARWPHDPALPLHGFARSASCGSTLTMGLRIADGRIVEIGLLAQACAVGQASAAIFAEAAPGRDAAAIAAAERAIAAWLAGTAPMPDWPGLAAIAPAQNFPARHGAILLAWRAALDALSTAPPAR